MRRDHKRRYAPAQRDLAEMHSNLGRVHTRRRDLAAARLAFGETLKIVRQLAADEGKVNVLTHRDLLVNYQNLAAVASKAGDFRETIDWLTQALAVANGRPDVFAGESRYLEGRLRILRAAAKVFDNIDAIKEVPEADRPEVLGATIISFVQRKNLDKALATADRLAQLGTKPGDLYNSACGYALCVPLADKPEVKERYAALAVSLLKQAAAQDYKVVARMDQDSDLDALRERDDFKVLLRESAERKPEIPQKR